MYPLLIHMIARERQQDMRVRAARPRLARSVRRAAAPRSSRRRRVS